MVRQWRCGVSTGREAARAEARAELEIRSYSLAELRRHLSITQEDLAAALHVNQPAVEKLERAVDMSLSRLRNAVEALGGELEVGVRIDGVLLPLQLLERESA